jgi:hypothetical protein
MSHPTNWAWVGRASRFLLLGACALGLALGLGGCPLPCPFC